VWGLGGEVTIDEVAFGWVGWTDVNRSPRILDLSWGRMEVEGLGVGKDFKLYPGGGRLWDWSLSGTQHEPGILCRDVDDLLNNGATVVVLSQGMQVLLQIPLSTIEYLEGRAVTVHVASTREAVRIYNELAETTTVGGLFHSTC
jgi:hypothetical protein